MNITFDEVGHTYTNEQGEIIPSVTQILGTVYGTGIEKAPSYYVERAADKGTKIHKAIEAYLKEGKESELKEFSIWKDWYSAISRQHFESEKIISGTTENGAFAGTLDFYSNGWIYDWKTCKTATRKQLDKWQKQLSFYTYAMRQYGYTVHEPAKVLHLTDKFEVIPLEYLGDKFVEETMALYRDGKKHEENRELISVSKNELQILEDTLFQINSLEHVVEEIRTKIREEMEQRGILDLQVGNVKMTYVAGTIRSSFDTKKFKEEHLDLYKTYQKDVIVKPSVRITINGK